MRVWTMKPMPATPKTSWSGMLTNVVLAGRTLSSNGSDVSVIA